MRLGPQVQLLRSGDREERRLEKTGTKLPDTSPSGRTEGSPVPRRRDEASRTKDDIPRKKRTLLCGWRVGIDFLKQRRTERGHVQLCVPNTDLASHGVVLPSDSSGTDYSQSGPNVFSPVKCDAVGNTWKLFFFLNKHKTFCSSAFPSRILLGEL